MYVAETRSEQNLGGGSGRIRLPGNSPLEFPLTEPTFGFPPGKGFVMTLEETILDRTANTPSGGICQLGEVSFRVRYCSDFWEWEYLGETYWDPLDLAEAIVRSGMAVRWRDPDLATEVNAKQVRAQTKRPAAESLPEAGSPRPRKELQ